MYVYYFSAVLEGLHPKGNLLFIIIKINVSWFYYQRDLVSSASYLIEWKIIKATKSSDSVNICKRHVEEVVCRNASSYPA